MTGQGQDRRMSRHKIYWLITQLGEDKFKAQALNGDHVPSGVARTVGRAEFLTHYTPEYDYFLNHIRPQLEEQGRKSPFGRSQDFGPSFVEEERQRLNTFAISLRKSGNLDQAIRYYLNAIKIDNRDDHLHFNLARAYYDSGNVQKCEAHLDKALAINPSQPWARKFKKWLGKQAKPARQA